MCALGWMKKCLGCCQPDGSAVTWGDGLLGTPVGNYLVLKEVEDPPIVGGNWQGSWAIQIEKGRWAAAGIITLLPEYRCNVTSCFRFLLRWLSFKMDCTLGTVS